MPRNGTKDICGETRAIYEVVELNTSKRNQRHLPSCCKAECLETEPETFIGESKPYMKLLSQMPQNGTRNICGKTRVIYGVVEPNASKWNQRYLPNCYRTECFETEPETFIGVPKPYIRLLSQMLQNRTRNICRVVVEPNASK